MATKKKRIVPKRRTKVIGASCDATDQERLDGYIERAAAKGVRLRPGQAVGALMRRGLDVEEAEARS